MMTVSGTSIGPGGTTIGPYRATRLWNDVIRTFRSGMPTSRHRRQLRTYEDCFVATEAINWLHSHLARNPNFGPEVTRIQTIQLLQKFKKAGVFQDVRGSKKEDFEDNGKLYKFAQTSPLKAVRTPLAVRINAVNQRNDTLFIRPAKIDYEKLKPVTCIPEAGLPQCEVVTQRSLTAVEIENEYKNMTLNCLKKILGVESFEEILDTGWASGKTIMHNMTYVTKSGYVTNIDKKDHLPHWVLSAMRCLANWPNRIDDNIPDYVGFEKDVFKVVKDYFQGLKEPLLTYTMYDLITNVLALIKKDLKKKEEKPAIKPPVRQYQSIGNIPMFASAENLMMNMTLNGHENNVKLSPIYAEWDRAMYGRDVAYRHEFDSGISPVSNTDLYRNSQNAEEFSKRSNETYTINQPRGVSTDQGYYSSFDNVSVQQSNQGPNNKPRYTLVRFDSMGNVFDDAEYSSEGNYSYLSNSQQRFSSVQNIPAALSSSSNLPQTNRYYSMSDLTSAQEFLGNNLSTCSPKYDSQQSVSECGSSRYTSHQSVSEYGYRSEVSLSVPKSNNMRDYQSSAPLPRYVAPPPYNTQHQPVISGALLRQTSSSSTASYKTAPSQNNSSNQPSSFMSARSFENASKSFESKNASCSHNMSSNSANRSSTPFAEERKYGAKMQKCDSTASLFCLFDNEVHNKVKNALQLSCLLLPSGSRRKLHLLLRLMNKMVNNQDLSTLDENIPVRTLILETFCRSILRCEEEADLDELLALRLVTFMVDNYEEIMKVPQELKNNIEERLVYLRRAKIRYTTDDFAPLTYCAQVTTREYETQKMSISQQAMADLLENIIKDKNISQKDKKKKMKVFQKTYPDIYNRRFPTNESEAVIFKPKIKQPLLARPLQRLKTLRL